MTAAITLYACSPVENTADSVKNPAVLTPDITNVPQEQAEAQQEPAITQQEQAESQQDPAITQQEQAESQQEPAITQQEQAESQQDPVDITGEPDNEITSENEFHNPQADAFAERISQEI